MARLLRAHGRQAPVPASRRKARVVCAPLRDVLEAVLGGQEATGGAARDTCCYSVQSFRGIIDF